MLLRCLPRYRSLSPLLLPSSSCWAPTASGREGTVHPPLPHIPPSLHLCLDQAREISTSQAMLSKKEGVMVRFKQMVKDYWYIIIPVEAGTSVIWYGAIFVSLKSGVDIVDLLLTIGVSENTLAKLPSAGGDYGYHALAFVCYKVISPLRHLISLGISGALVSRLEKTRPGYLRTSSSIAKEARETGEDMKEKYDEKVAEGRERMDELKIKYDEKVAEGRERMEERMEEWRRKK